MTTVFQVEIDPYAQKVLARHWPYVPRFTDVRHVGVHNLPACDVLCGGFPCQDISSDGRRAGINGERSGLWREFHRLVRELRPRYVIVENVEELRRRGSLARVLGDLASSGYDAEWECLPACAFGAPHRRDRIFIVAYPQTFGREVLEVFDRNALPRVEAEKPWNYIDGLDVAQRRALEAAAHAIRVDDGAPKGVDCRRLAAIGNAVHPDVSEFVGRCIVRHAELAP